MILEKITKHDGSMEELLQLAQHGDKILLHQGDTSQWAMSYSGLNFYHSALGCIYRNGEKILEGITGTWGTCGEKLILIEDRKITDLLEGDQVLFEGEFDSWEEMGDGSLLVRKGDRILKDGKPIYDGETAAFKLEFHPKGFSIERYDTIYLNGTRMIFKFPTKKQPDWRGHELGVVVCNANTFYLNNSFPIHSDWCTAWGTHKHGLILEQEDKVYLVVLKTPTA